MKMVSTRMVPRSLARILQAYFQYQFNRHKRHLERKGVSTDKIDELEQQFKRLKEQRIGGLGVETEHYKFSKLYHRREKMREAARKAEKWKNRADEARKPRLRFRRA